jgi:hypothetical protein
MLKSFGDARSFDSRNAQFNGNGFVFAEQITQENFTYCKNMESLYICITNCNGILLCRRTFWPFGWKIMSKRIIFQEILLTLWVTGNNQSRVDFNLSQIRRRRPQIKNN